MAKKQTPPAVTTPAPKLTGTTFFLDTKIAKHLRDQLKIRIRVEGGTTVPRVSSSLSHLVLDRSRNKTGGSVPEKSVAKANAAGASIEVIDTYEFYELVQPTHDELVALLRSGQAGKQHFHVIRPGYDEPHDLVIAKADLRGVNFSFYNFFRTQLVNVDFRDANLSYATLHHAKGLRLDGATLDKCVLGLIAKCKFDGLSMKGARFDSRLIDACTFRKTDLSECTGWRVHFLGCDLNEANFQKCGLHRSKAERTRARGADFRFGSIRESLLSETDFTKADFTDGDLGHTDLSGAKLNSAKFVRANLLEVNLSGADLRKADLTDANLAWADLTRANVKGADFTGANLDGAKLDGLDTKSAKGLAEASRTFVPGPSLSELQKLAKSQVNLSVGAKVLVDDEVVVELTMHSQENGKRIYISEHGPLAEKHGNHRYGISSVPIALRDLVRRHQDGKLLLDSIWAKGGRATKARDRLVLAAWCELFELPMPTPKELEERIQQEHAETSTRQEALIKQLRSGSKGVKAWNALEFNERRGHCLEQIDLSSADLQRIDLSYAKCKEANFSGANLQEASLLLLAARQTNFSKTNLVQARLSYGDFTKADFHEANLTKADLSDTNLREVNFRKANLTKSNLQNANLRAADLSQATLTGANLYRAKYDSKTKLPKGFSEFRDMKWMESTPAPSAKLKKKVTAPAETLEFAEFMKRLRRTCDKSKLNKSLKMLKADRFQLFAEVGDDYLSGVVRSQSEQGLVYACRLDAAGDYACCTQNLNVCGGLKGSPCKHLLVLLVGLAKSEKLDSGKAYQWIATASKERPRLDKDAMSETFLRYKSAEAGEVDWRPTETIPEDFYAL